MQIIIVFVVLGLLAACSGGSGPDTASYQPTPPPEPEPSEPPAATPEDPNAGNPPSVSHKPHPADPPPISVVIPDPMPQPWEFPVSGTFRYQGTSTGLMWEDNDLLNGLTQASRASATVLLEATFDEDSPGFTIAGELLNVRLDKNNDPTWTRVELGTISGQADSDGSFVHDPGGLVSVESGVPYTKQLSMGGEWTVGFDEALDRATGTVVITEHLHPIDNDPDQVWYKFRYEGDIAAERDLSQPLSPFGDKRNTR